MARGKVVRSGYKGGAAAAGSPRSIRGGPKSEPLTHFLCLPLVNDITRPQLEASLDRFRDIVQQHNERPGSTDPIPLKAIRPLGTLHLTLGVMSVGSVDRISEAIGFLQTLDIQALMQEAIKGKHSTQTLRDDRAIQLRVSLTSLHSMHPPRRTSILYAGPEDRNEILMPFCNKLRSAFSSAGFLVQDDRPLKLHATMLNTIYVKATGRQAATLGATTSKTTAVIDNPSSEHGGSEAAPNAEGAKDDRSRGHGPNAKAPIRLDATTLLEQCKDFVWTNEFTIDKVAICEMGAKKIMDEEGNILDEHYQEVAAVELPT